MVLNVQIYYMEGKTDDSKTNKLYKKNYLFSIKFGEPKSYRSDILKSPPEIGIRPSNETKQNFRTCWKYIFLLRNKWKMVWL